MMDEEWEPPMMPIDYDPQCFLTRAELVEINEESRAIGLSRILPDEWLAEIPADAVIPILGAWKHRSCQGQKTRASGNFHRAEATNSASGMYPWNDGPRSRGRARPSPIKP